MPLDQSPAFSQQVYFIKKLAVCQEEISNFAHKSCPSVNDWLQIRRVQEYRRVFTRYDKLDVMYMGFVVFGFIVEAFR